jgi:hypothetical protein
MTKVDTIDAVRRSLELHNIACPGEVDISLGKVELFDMSQSGEVDVLIQHGEVYYFIHCPLFMHDSIVHELQMAFLRAVEEALGERCDDLVFWAGSSDVLVQNQLGCHAWEKKHPDSQLRLQPEFRERQKYPLLIIEVALKHEDLHKLLCEGALWLNDKTDVQFASLAKIWEEEKKLEIFILKRAQHNEFGPKRVVSNKSKADQIRALPDLASYYCVTVVYHEIFEAREDNLIIEVDLSTMFANAGLDVPELRHPLLINLTRVLRQFFNLVNIS